MSLRWNERLIARLNAEKETPQYRNTSSRLHKWKELVEIAQKDLDLPVASPERIMPGHGTTSVASAMIHCSDFVQAGGKKINSHHGARLVFCSNLL